MDPITQQTVLAAAGAAGGDPVYVDDVFSTTLYVGDSNAGSQVVNTGIDNTEESMVWIKSRTTTFAYNLFDTVRGTGYRLSSDDSAAQVSDSTGVTAFNSNGITVGGSNYTNGQNADIVAWNFKAAPGFFDVVTWSGNSTAGRQIPHALGSTPGMIIVKRLTATENWYVYHRSLGATKYLKLSTNDSVFTGTNQWNDTAPTSTHFTVGTDTSVNTTGSNYVAYIFAHDDASFGTGGNESIIKCGSYSGNSGSQAIDLGFEPQWVMVKNTSSSADWVIFDVMRNVGSKSSSTTSSPDQSYLIPNATDAETTDLRFYVNNTGFELVSETQSRVNYSGNNYIYMAIRRPHKPPTAGTEVYQALNYTGSSGDIKRATNIAVDLVHTHRTTSGTPYVLDRMRGGYNYINTASANSEGDQPTAIHTFGNNFLHMGTGAIINSSSNYILEMFKRAPGFFDIVTYEGNGTADHAVPHQLGVVPELVFVKTRNFSNHWSCYTSTGGLTNNLNWSDPGAETTNGTPGQRWGPTAFTSTHIYLGSYSNTNYNNKPHIGYLFASLDKISKIGRYTGTGNNINVDCGFTAGARFVMIKRTDTEISGATGTNWYYWDSLRGIVSGNDPYMMINLGNSQVTNTDYIDPLNAGFTVTASAPAALNASGGTYLFLAIA